jgi:S1-C subfamily serine protease
MLGKTELWDKCFWILVLVRWVCWDLGLIKSLMRNLVRQLGSADLVKAFGVVLGLVGLAIAACSQSVAQAPGGGATDRLRDPAIAAAICPIVYPVEENPSAHGYQYAFYGNAFFISRDGLLITAAHVLHSFRNGGQPHILVQRVEAPPQMLKAEIVLEDREHDVAVLRATPNPFAGKVYRVGTLAPDATPVARGEAIIVAALRPKRRQPHSFETELEDRSAADVIDFQNSVLEKGFGETELVLFNHEVILGQSGAPVLAAGSGEVVAFIEGQWLRPAAGLAVEMKRGEEAHSVGAAVPVRYVVEALRGKGIVWEGEVAKQ